MKSKFIFSLSFLVLILVPACHPQTVGNHSYITFVNDSNEDVFVDWTFDKRIETEVSRLIRRSYQNTKDIIHSKETSNNAVATRYPNVFEEMFNYRYNYISDIEYDTLYVFIIKHGDILLARESNNYTFDYWVYKCSQEDLIIHDWIIVYPDWSEEYHAVTKDYPHFFQR